MFAKLGKGNEAAHEQRYGALLDAEPEVLDNGETRLGAGRLWRKKGINVLYVHGDRFEMAYQHGRLLREEIADGSLQQASKISDHGIDNSVGDGALGSLVKLYVRHLISGRMLRHAVANAPDDPEVHLAEAYGLSAGSGVPVDTIIKAALGPESAQVLMGLTESGIGIGTSANHCTSFAAWGESTDDGEMIIGRNTDYPLAGYFDRHPTLVYFDPTDDGQKFMTITSAGFHNAGVCGLNESGLYLAVHTVVSSHVSAAGMPVFMAGQQVLRAATGFDHALELLDRFRPAAGWSYHIASARENRCATLEMANDATGLRVAEGDTHVTTNHWSHPDMVERFLDLNRSVDDDSQGRARRAEQMLQERRGTLDARGAAEILGDKFDPITGAVRAFPNTIAAHYTVSSAIWRPTLGHMYMASGTVPVSQGSYVQFPTCDRFDPETFAAHETPSFDNDDFRKQHPQAAAAEQLFVRAKCAFEYRADLPETLRLMREVNATDDSNPAYHFIQGLVAAKLGEFGEADAAADRVLELATDATRIPLARYLKARIAAHRGKRDEARTLLVRVRSDHAACSRLRDATVAVERKLKWRRRLPLGPRDIAFMGFLPDAYRYDAMPLLPWSGGAHTSADELGERSQRSDGTLQSSTRGT